MPRDCADGPSAEGLELRAHLAAAEGALRRIARTSRCGGERSTAERHADVVAQIQRDFQGRQLSEGAVTSAELVDALLAGTDALRLQADGKRQGAAHATDDPQQRAKRLAKAAEYDRYGDEILELDRDIAPRS